MFFGNIISIRSYLSMLAILIVILLYLIRITGTLFGQIIQNYRFSINYYYFNNINFICLYSFLYGHIDPYFAMY